MWKTLQEKQLDVENWKMLKSLRKNGGTEYEI